MPRPEAKSGRAPVIRTVEVQRVRSHPPLSQNENAALVMSRVEETSLDDESVAVKVNVMLLTQSRN